MVGGGAVENIIPEVLHGQPQMSLHPPHEKQDLAIREDLLLLKGPQKFFEQQVSGGVEVGGVGKHVDMLFVGGQLREHDPLHFLAKGGWETMVGGSAHHDEDLPFVEEDLVTPLQSGLPQGRSYLNAEAVLEGAGHKSGEVAVLL